MIANGVASDIEFSLHVETLADQPRVAFEIWDDEEIVRLLKRMRTDGLVERRLEGREPAPSLEPLPVEVDQADQRYRRVAHFAGDTDDVVELGLRRRVKDFVFIESDMPRVDIGLIQESDTVESVDFVLAEVPDAHDRSPIIDRVGGCRI